ncbi:ankyrin repeat-containing domain protein [Colletotrichum phormii]|uniref:Ankyrin repeat-containing domain protein n=1 Tax=Colletotrichum phormii TaxID=359342 RepID=A0AAI9ZFC7_9PEZI|nr:ankyrin repeat-containing domain protein [Colletotrichum phormii]KAK1623532.1 ankyrin repeat-containing domain protein [Colletotrichum phormii]
MSSDITLDAEGFVRGKTSMEENVSGSNDSFTQSPGSTNEDRSTIEVPSAMRENADSHKLGFEDGAPLESTRQDPAPKGDLILIVGPSRHEIRVYPLVLSNASPIFASTIPRANYNKDPAQSDPARLSLSNDDPKAMDIICHVLHRNSLNADIRKISPTLILAVDKSAGNPKPGKPIDGQPADSKRKPREATDREQSPLRQLLSTMATPLHIAVQHGLVGAVEELLKAGAKLETRNSADLTPLMMATETEQVDIMAQLLTPRSGYEGVASQLEMCFNTGETPLLWATINGFSEGVKHLIAAGADCNGKNICTGSTPLIEASIWGYWDIVEMLLDTSNPNGRADIDLQSENGATALHEAAYRASFAIVNSLLNANAKLNILCQDGNAPLHIATNQGNEHLVTLLAVSNVDVTNAFGQTALHLGSNNGDVRIARLLLEARATADARDEDGLTPLHVAIKALRNVQNDLALYQSGLGDLTEETRNIAELHSGQYVSTIELLLSDGAEPGARTPENETALHFAVACGELFSLQIIMEYMKQEDLLIRNKNGQTALSSILKLKGQRRATAMRTFLKLDSPKIDEFDQEDTWEHALYWAANDPKLHDIVRLILQHMTRMDTTLPPGSENRNAIGWAANLQLPRLLILLISRSPGTVEATKALESVLASNLELVEDPGSKDSIGELPLVIWLFITASSRNREMQNNLIAALNTLETLISRIRSRKMDPRSNAGGNEYLDEDQ